jgi:hypothetical protein
MEGVVDWVRAEAEGLLLGQETEFLKISLMHYQAIGFEMTLPLG